MSTETKLCCGPRFGVFVPGKNGNPECVTCGAPESPKDTIPGDPRTTHMNTLNISIDSWEDMSLPIEHCAEYDSAAEWCAIRGLKGKVGDPLPANMDPNGALKYINADPESFEKRVRQFAYARAMSNINLRDVFKSMRMAVNAIDDGLPRLAQEILGDALRTYGEEQP